MSPYLKGAVDALGLANLCPTKFFSLETHDSTKGPTMLIVNVVRMKEQDLLSSMVPCWTPTFAVHHLFDLGKVT